MYKEASYKEKYAALADWLPLIIETIKKDIKNEHLKKDFYFVKKYLNSKNLNKVSVEELTAAYQRAINEEENSEALGEFITSRWLLKNSELYDFFEQQLNQISADFTALDEIDLASSQAITKASVSQFGAPHTYIFAVLNSVVFPESVFNQLKQQAHQKSTQQKEEKVQISEKMGVEAMQKAFERETARLTDKYEKKLAGLQKKYLMDVEGLKKQVAQLQRKLQEKS